MTTPTITAIITYSTNDFRFLKEMIHNLKPFCQEIIVSVSDHFFDGTEQAKDLLHASYAAHPEVFFLEYAYSEKEPFGIYCPWEAGEVGWLRYWIGTSRYVGIEMSQSKSDFFLFVDADEVVDGNGFQAWLKEEKWKDADMFYFASYVYLGHAGNRSLEIEQNTALLVRASHIEPLSFLNHYERRGVYNQFTGIKKYSIVGKDGLPFIHHYQWVRSPKELLKKVHTWGHRDDKNWKEIIEQKRWDELSPYTFVDVAPVHNIADEDLVLDTLFSSIFPHVEKITPQDVRKKSIDKLLDILDKT